MAVGNLYYTRPESSRRGTALSYTYTDEESRLTAWVRNLRQFRVVHGFFKEHIALLGLSRAPFSKPSFPRSDHQAVEPASS